jgi:dTDP-4-dehydrorhamnose reductase
MKEFDAAKGDSLVKLFLEVRPDLVINCIGVVKQGILPSDTVRAIELNSLLPHRLNKLCNEHHARLFHISTDCVFDGSRGNYTEFDLPNPLDVYGQSKALGERLDDNALVIRTSCVGPEARSQKKGLLEWFLAQQNEVLGYSRAIFSGITTLELAKVLSQYFLDGTCRVGLWNLSSNPIDKFSLLKFFKEAYHKNIDIIVDDALIVDRSLDSSKFRRVSGYNPPDWPAMIKEAIIFEDAFLKK